MVEMTPKGYGSMKGQANLRDDIDLAEPVYAQAEGLISEDKLREMVRGAIAASGVGQNQWARLNGVAISSVSDFLRERRGPDPALRAALNVRRVVWYKKGRDE